MHKRAWLLLGALFPNIMAAQAAKTLQIAADNIVVRFATSQSETAAREILAAAVEAREELAKLDRLASLKFDKLTSLRAVEIWLSATTYEFCQITGRPWWQASVYRSGIIYLQPLRVLRERGSLATTLRHELMHHWVEELSQGNSPRWLSEALAIYHSGEIALLKPARQKVKPTELRWRELDKRLERTATQAEAVQLYFQLYFLGQFLEKNFTLEKIARLLQSLGEQKTFAQAGREHWGEETQTIEKNWRQYAQEKLNTVAFFK